jgi:hypothetical protein
MGYYHHHHHHQTPMLATGGYVGERWNGGVPYEASMPPVSALLMREADAWRALLGLHQGVLGTARQLAMETTECDGSAIETTQEAIEAREAAYYAGLTQLVSACDQLSTEALRLRALRKARCNTDAQALQALMRAHSTETLAVGATLAGNTAVQVQAATAELRQATQATRQQLAQVRAVLQLVQDHPPLRGTLRIGHVPEGGGDERSFEPAAVIEAVYHHGETLSEATLVKAMAELCGPGPSTATPVVGGAPSAPSAPARQVVRRGSDGRRDASER